MSRRYMFSNRGRIDARPQNSDATQAGMRNVHRDMRGNVIGGVTAEGQGIGTKARAWQTPPSGMDRKIGFRPGTDSLGNSATPGLDRLAGMQSSAINRRKRAWNADVTMPATGNVLNSRRNLYKKMQAAGPDGITDDMRKQARALGVTDSGFNMATEKIRKWKSPII